MYQKSILAILLSASLASFATNASDDMFTPEKVSAALSLGTLNGEAKQRNYFPLLGNKISQLNWKYRNVPIVKGNLDWDIMPWVTLGAGGWTTINDSRAKMDSYYWLPGHEQKDNYSDIRLKNANEFDANIKGWLLSDTSYRFGIMAGYSQSLYNWRSKSNSGNEEFSKFGDFSPRYSQKFKIPYIGLTGLYRYDKFDIGSTVKYSGWVRASDKDQRFGDLLTVNSKVKSQSYYSVSASAGYYVTDNARIYLEGTWNRIPNKKGDSIVDGGGTFKPRVSDVASIEHTDFITTAGLQYTF